MLSARHPMACAQRNPFAKPFATCVLYSHYLVVIYTSMLNVSAHSYSNAAAPTSTKYVFVNTAANWPAAEADCVARGGHLASIASAADNQEIQSLCAQKLPNAQLNSGGGCWIGLNDQATEGKYVWSDGSTVSYTSWHQGPLLPQPDDDAQTKYNEDCVLFVVAAGYVGWHDWGCEDVHVYVCKVPVSQQQQPSPSPSSVGNITVPAPTVLPPSPVPTAGSGSTSPAAGATSGGSSGSISDTISLGAGSSSTAVTASGSTGSTAVTTTAPAVQATGGTAPSTVSTAGTANSSANSANLAAGIAGSSNSSADAAAGSNTGSQGSDTWKLVVSIVVPVLTGLAATITIAYTGWKWWHKRQATIARRRGIAGFVSGVQGNNVKPLIAVDHDV